MALSDLERIAIHGRIQPRLCGYAWTPKLLHFAIAEGLDEQRFLQSLQELRTAAALRQQQAQQRRVPR